GQHALEIDRSEPAEKLRKGGGKGGNRAWGGRDVKGIGIPGDIWRASRMIHVIEVEINLAGGSLRRGFNPESSFDFPFQKGRTHFVAPLAERRGFDLHQNVNRSGPLRRRINVEHEIDILDVADHHAAKLDWRSNVDPLNRFVDVGFQINPLL